MWQSHFNAYSSFELYDMQGNCRLNAYYQNQGYTIYFANNLSLIY